MTKLIESIHIKHYRGLKEEHKMDLSEFGKISFLIGPNNSGKSLMARVFSIFDSKTNNPGLNYFATDFCDRDFYEFNIEKPIEIKFDLNTSLFDGNNDADIIRLVHLKIIRLCFEIRKISGHFICFMYLNHQGVDSHKYEEINTKMEYNEAFTSTAFFSEINKEKVERTCTKLYEELKNRILIFDSIRSFDRNSYSSFFRSGAELIEWLNENKNPSETSRVRSTLSHWLKNHFNLDVPNHIGVEAIKKQLIFTFDNHLDLSSQEVGTGYTMLCILLMEIARGKKNFVIIDEIESHLQPGLVRVLIKILRESKQTQYVIATHSPTAIESSMGDDRLYRFTKFEGKCTFEGFFRSPNKSGRDAKMLREVANELGIIPGDAFLSNSVIWVEGPSEVYWIRAWLRTYFELYKKKEGIKGNIIEGLHYTILMTGGNNIAHYSFVEEEIELIQIDDNYNLNVLKVNPNPFVIIDSDNANKDSKKHKRMLRIAIELKEQNNLNPLFRTIEDESKFDIKKLPNMWLLEGKELENYAHPQLIKQFYQTLNDSAKSKVSGVLESTNWDVFSSHMGVGKILTDQGIVNVSDESGTVKHKALLARYIFNNFNQKYLIEEKIEEIIKPNPIMMKDLLENLEKLVVYIIKVNNLN
jgi:hypothetical protein